MEKEFIIDDEDFAEQKRQEFIDYVEDKLPGFSYHIDWEHFHNLISMEDNFTIQTTCWLYNECNCHFW